MPCDTPDNAVLLCETDASFPMRIETKRIAPGEMNTWVIEIDGTEGSIAYTTKAPEDAAHDGLRAGRPAGVAGAPTSARSRPIRRSPARSSSSGSPDAIQQMWAAFLDELAHGAEHARPVPLRDARGGGRHAPDLHSRAGVRRTGTVVEL